MVALVVVVAMMSLLTEASMSHIWTYAIPNDTMLATYKLITTSDSVLFVVNNRSNGDSTGSIVSLNGFTGAERWSFSVSSGVCNTYSFNWIMLYPYEDIVVVDCTTSCSACAIFAVNATTGNLMWQVAAQSTSELSNGVLDETRGVFYRNYVVVMGTVTLAAFNVADGSALWSRTLEDWPEVTTLAGSGDVLIMQHPSNPIRAINATNGKSLWTYNIVNDQFWGTSSAVLVLSPNTGIVGLDPSTGALLWKGTSDSYISGVLDLGAGRCLLSNGSQLLVVSCSTGSTIEQHSLPGNVAGFHESGGFVFAHDRSGALIILTSQGKRVSFLNWTCSTEFGSCQYPSSFVFSSLSTFVMGSQNVILHPTRRSGRRQMADGAPEFMVTQFAMNGTAMSQLPSVRAAWRPPAAYGLQSNLAVFTDLSIIYAVSVN